jgi:small subunit ribosomal protein S16
MLMLRLQRIGRRNEAHFKIVVIEKTKGPKSQKYVDIVGSYNPKMGTVIMDEDKVKKWLSTGVQPSDTVYNMLVTKGLVEGRKRNNLPKKSPVIDHEAIAQAAKIAEEKAVAEQKARDEGKAAQEVAEKAAKLAAEEAAKAAKELEETAIEEVAPQSEEAPAQEIKPETVESSVETPTSDELEAAQEGSPEKITEA